VPREVQILPNGKTGDCLFTGTQAILVCFVYLGRLDKGTPFPFTSQGDNPPSLVTLDAETSQDFLHFLFDLFSAYLIREDSLTALFLSQDPFGVPWGQD
jgi:hypothetical protein